MKKVQLDVNRRQDLADAYVQRLIDDMDMKTLLVYAYDSIMEKVSDYTDFELMDAVSWDLCGRDEQELQEFCEDLITQDEINSYIEDCNTPEV